MSIRGNLFRGVKVAFPSFVQRRSSGVWVETECGRRLLDFTSCFGVTNLGHGHPAVVAAAKRACDEAIHCQQSIMKHRPLLNLVDRLANLDVSRRYRLDSWFIWNSGTEAVEAACKLARQATGRPNIIAMQGAYHGRTYLSMALTTSGAVYRSQQGPLPGGVVHVPFPLYTVPPATTFCSWPDAASPASRSGERASQYWGATSPDVASSEVRRCLEAIEIVQQTQTLPTETAAILLEPMLGEAGYVPAPPGYLSGLRKICDKHGILLIFDEVQTGFGRTGSWFACEWIDGGVRPDILISAKGLGNGFPISAVGTRSEISNLQTPGSMGGTYGGNAVSCAAAAAVIDTFEAENVLENSLKRGEEFRTLLREKLNELPAAGGKTIVREIRGRGLGLGLELRQLTLPAADECATNESDCLHVIIAARSNAALTLAAPGQTVAMAISDAIGQNLMMLQAGTRDTVRLTPALNISKEDLELGANTIVRVLNSLTSKHR